jgi:hypothetical protein
MYWLTSNQAFLSLCMRLPSKGGGSLFQSLSMISGQKKRYNGICERFGMKLSTFQVTSTTWPRITELRAGLTKY